MPRGFAYSRVSTPRQVSGAGLKGQDEAREKWLADHPELDIQMVEDYRDLGVTGRGKNVTEGKMGLIMEGIRTHKIAVGDYLLVDSLDRITREELIDAHYLVSGIIRDGVIIVTIADGMIFDRSDKERMMFNLMISLVVLARSSNESDAKSSRGLRNWAAKRADAEATGKPMTAMTPAWIDTVTNDNRRTYVLNRHAKTVERIFELRAAGLGAGRIIQALINENREPMATDRRADGGTWSRNYVSKILANRAVIGEFTPGNKNHATHDKRHLTGQVWKNHFPPAVSPDLWLKVEASLTSDGSLSPTRNRRGDFSNLFAGLCRCVGCGSALTIVHKQKPANLSYLRCPLRYDTKTCSEGRAYSYAALERAVLDNLKGILLDPAEPVDDRILTLKNRAAELKIEIERISANIGRLVAKFGDDDEDAGPQIEKLKQQRMALRTDLTTIDNERMLASRPLPTFGDFERLRELRRQAEAGTPDERISARAQLRQALRSILTLIGFYPDGSVVLEVANGFKFMGLINSGGRNATFRPHWMVSVDTTTGVPRYGYIVPRAKSGETRQEFARWDDDPEFFSIKFEAPLATLQRLNGLGTGGKQSRDVESQIMQRIERQDPTRTDDRSDGQTIH